LAYILYVKIIAHNSSLSYATAFFLCQLKTCPYPPSLLKEKIRPGINKDEELESGDGFCRGKEEDAI